MRYLPNAATTSRMTTEELRASFLVSDIFRPGEVRLEIVDLDRVVIGGAVPTGAPLRLEAHPDLLAEYFTERRELGVLNIGGVGTVTVDGTRHLLGRKDVLYVGRGSRDVSFESADAKDPARFYLVSYPAHASHPTTVVTQSEAQGATIGALETANRRRVARYIHTAGARSAQLVMGVTTLEPGSVWNTMPAHTHHRRTEIYLYFDLPHDAIVLHLLGQPSETRTIVVRDGEVALSPGWSVHAGCGTSAYSFCWAMGGENQDYADMQPVDISTLR
ncbi:KduI/IolB isomerase [Gemmatirosa kalamazoonensis]|uniref:5-dehydro-4-deoxy-D-glucuronate isomerase n=1 Tax=Gemmatirosa kalamazoonensis TaxID=861299 RepID=W0RAT7_9BACT|nr:5-dehydro-4-deoxy-D-glucuronate isomerase [Gemmatirosa kalamazoonensis]AHG87906.1 KduI/IolB isomerase [Gemmatirosa kalamazoonensis]